MAHHRPSSLFRLLTPILRTNRNPASTTAPITQTLALRPTIHSKQTAPSSSTIRHISSTAPILAAPPQRRGGGIKNRNEPTKDPRITLIRYHLQHPKTPRPLRFSRMRALRHWTIHRAWMLFRRKKAMTEELDLQRLYTSMRAACEVLRNLDPPGTKDAGRLFRIAMGKQGIFRPGGVPIEYARAQTETPGTEAWDHNWKR